MCGGLCSTASYQVLGLGDVYLGAPVAAPIDPRHRLVTTKYNPARTWTPENAVGIGGAYLCIYGMAGPGGYQFLGRTVQVWNTFKSTKNFEPGVPWLLRFFDCIRFYPVSASELLEMRDAFPHGKFEIEIEPSEFSFPEYKSFLQSIENESKEFKTVQQEAFAEERARWAASGKTIDAGISDEPIATIDTAELPEGIEAVSSPLTASVWNIAVQPGQRVELGQRLVVLEAMKMEVVVTAHVAGFVHQLRVNPGVMVTPGQHLVTLRTDGSNG